MVLLNPAVSKRIVEVQCVSLSGSCFIFVGVPYRGLSPALEESTGVLDEAE